MASKILTAATRIRRAVALAVSGPVLSSRLSLLSGLERVEHERTAVSASKRCVR